MHEELIEKVEELIQLPQEWPWFEFKENWYEPVQLGEYISALANSAAFENEPYAYFVWGINDETHEVVGTSFDFRQDYQKGPLENFLAVNLDPDVNFRFTEIEVHGKRVVVLKIPKADKFIVSFKGKRFFRIGSSKADLARYPEREMALMDIIKNGYPTLENTESSRQDLSFVQLFTYFAGKGIALKQVNFKKNLGLLTKDGKFNLLAQILSDDSGIPIRFSIFRGKTKADPLYSVREFGNCCILVSLDKLIDYGDTINLIQADETNRRVERKDVPLFEPSAFFEATLNAILHNKWTTGYGPAFTMYSDRLEILSRGALPPAQTVVGFYRGDSVPVNASLAKIINQLHISETSGRGVPKITSFYGENSIEISENTIRVTIPFNFLTTPKSDMGDKVRDKVGVKLNGTQRKMLELLRDNPNLTQPQLMIALGLGETAVQNNISFLRNHEFIRRIGSKKTGYWEVIADEE